MPDIDKLQIQIEASAEKAMPALDDMIGKLENLSNVLSGIKVSGLTSELKALSKVKLDNLSKKTSFGISFDFSKAMSSATKMASSIGKTIGSITSGAFQKVKSAASAATNGIKGFVTSLRSAKGDSKSLATILYGLYIKLWAFKKVASGFGTIAKKAMDFVESYHYFEMAFQKIGQDAADSWAEAGYDSAEAYAQSFQDRALELTEKMSGFAIDSNGGATLTGGKSLGMDPNMLLNYQAQYGQMANGLGLVSTSAENASKALTMLGADWSSLRNIDFSTSYEKMASALAGQSRAVRSLGIDITQATLQQYAHAAGVQADVSQMDQAAKTELRLIAILDQSRVAWGDMAKTLNTPANQYRLLEQNVASLARTIGNIFLPILQKVLPYINGVVIALQRLFAWLAKLLGATPEQITTSMGGMDEAFEDFGDSAIDSMGDAADATEDLVDELEEAKKTILGFDELNVLNAPYSDKSGSDKKDDDSKKMQPGDMGLLDDYLASLLDEYEKKWNEAFDAMTNKAQEIADAIVNAFKSKDWAGLGKLMASGVEWGLQKVYDFLNPENMYPKLKAIADAITGTVNSFVSNFPADLLGRTLGRAVNDYVYFMNKIYDGIEWGTIGNKIAEAFLGLINTVNPYELGRLMTQKLRAAIEVFKGFLETMHGHWDKVGTKIGQMINGALSNIHPDDIAFVLSNAINAGIHILAGLLETFPFDELADKITTGLNDMIDWVEWDNLGATLGLMLMTLTRTITRILTSVRWEDLGRGIGAGLLRMVNVIDVDAPGELLKASMKAVLNFLYGGLNEFRTGGGFRKLAEMTSGLLNSTLGDQTLWDDLGDVLEELMKGALEYLYVTDKTIEWESIATNIHDFIKRFIDNKQLWDEAFETLTNWLKDICVFIRRALPTQEEWYTIGRRIGYYLGKLPWDEIMTTLIGAIKNAVVGIWEGLGETFAGNIIQGIIIFKVSWGLLSPFFSSIGSIITGNLSSAFMAKRIATMLNSSLTIGAEKATANVASNTALSGFAAKIGTVVEGAMPALSFAGFIGGVLGITRFLQKGSEYARGLNGDITSVGTTVENVSNLAMDQVGPMMNLTNDQREAILLLQDDLENAEASNSEMATAMAGLLSSFGYTASEIEGMAANAANGINASAEQTQFWADVVSQMPETVERANTQIDLSNINTKNAVDDITDAWERNKGKIIEATGLSGTHLQNFESVLAGVTGETLNANDAYERMKQRCEDLNVPVEYLNELFGITYPGAMSTAATATEEAKKSITQSTEEIKNKASSDAEEMMNKWKNGARGAATDSADAYDDARKRISKSTEQTATKVGTEAGKAADSAKSKTTQGLNDVVGTINNKSDDFTRAGRTVGEAAGTGTSTGITDKKKDVSDSADSAVDAAKESATTATSVFSIVGGSAMEAMKLGFSEKRDSVKDNLNAQLTIIKNNLDTSMFTSVGSDIATKIGEGINNSSLYSAGQSAINSLQRGLNSTHISMPHVGWNWERLDYGPADNRQWFEVPSLYVNWYAKGGLATAPTLAGIGEAGAEAVLPLTNKKAMSRIADAIATSGGGTNGLNRDDMVEAVATGVAMAMAQNPQTVEVVVQSILKTNDEKLAQSVARGNAKMNQRYNYG